MIALRNFRNSIFTTSRPRSRVGMSSPYQILRFQASAAITMYAQLLSRSLQPRATFGVRSLRNRAFPRSRRVWKSTRRGTSPQRE
jgi:hypothetical protein